MQRYAAKSIGPGRHPFAALPLYVGFAATGVGVALPGVSLPVMLQRWGLSDAQGGRLFLCAWLGSSVGALLVRGSLQRTLLTGCGLIVCGASALGFGTGTALHADVWMFLYGAGLGLVMTSISLIHQASAARRSGRGLIRLNLAWALGAFACPALAKRALAASDLRPVLGGLAAIFACVGLWCATSHVCRGVRTTMEWAAGWGGLVTLPFPLILMISLITGIEASAGGWLSTYAWRNNDGLGTVVAAPTCFWAGLLLSRVVWSLSTADIEVATVRGSAGLMTLAVTVLLLLPSAKGLVISAFCLGFGIGPVYPLLLDFVLRRTRGGPIFFLAGVGSACLPWLTGVVSSSAGSLRTGLLVPACGTLLLFTLAMGSTLVRGSSVES